MPQKPVQFPCGELPADPALARLLGLYPQRQEGLWMQRLKLVGGRLSGAQWRALADIARQFTPAEPLHLTTRQDVEIHGLSAETVPLAQAALAAAGMTGLGACGDTPRNVTVCPESGVRAGAADLHDLARRIREMLEATPGVWSLPRKFKISLSACPRACAQPWINDLGLILTQREGRRGFRAIVGGSLGAKPGTGMELLDFVPPGEVLPLVAAAVDLFAESGDRTNRSRARLRHVRERMGDAAFAEALKSRFEAFRRRAGWPEIELPASSDGLPDRAVLTFPNGDVSADAAEALGELCEAGTGETPVRPTGKMPVLQKSDGPDTAVRIDNQHRISVFGREPSLRSAVGRSAALRIAAVIQPSVVACPGSRWCSRGLADTNAVADRLRGELAGVLAPEATVCISGCPNGCAQHAVADVGLSGRRTKGPDGQPREVFDVTVGGGMGRNDRLGQVVAGKVPPERLAETIRAAMKGAVAE